MDSSIHSDVDEDDQGFEIGTAKGPEVAVVIVQSNKNQKSTDNRSNNTGILKPASTDSRSFRIEEYGHHGLGAGQPIDRHDKNPQLSALPPHQKQSDERSIYFPFKNQVDFDLAFWMLDSNISKAKIDRFCRQFSFQGPNGLTSWRSADELFTKMDSIPYGPTSEWFTRSIEVKTEPELLSCSSLKVRYRDIIDTIRFLLSHPPFRHSLAYAPVRLYNNKNERVYNEMHTGDWWWKTQEQLPGGGTLIPLLIGTDKTLLTKLRGDQSAWPVYLTIGNLSRATRRQQRPCPGTVLVGLIPIPKETSEGLLADVYHQSMAEIFDC